MNQSISFKIFLILMYMFAAEGLLAQEKKEVLNIRSVYETVNENIQLCSQQKEEPCNLYLNSMKVNKKERTWAVVGIYQAKIDFWYTMSGREYSDVTLQKINAKTKRSSRTENEEYLFDESGRLIFYFFQLK